MSKSSKAMTVDLYDCYMLQMKEVRGGMIASSISEENRDYFLRAIKSVSRKDFEASLKKMKPKQRKEFEQFLRTPYQQRRKEGLRATEHALHDFQTDPKVRERASREVEAAIKKG